MRLSLRPLDADGDRVPVLDAEGADACSLWRGSLCADRLLLDCLGAEPVPLPQPADGEPVPGILARAVRAVAGSGALLLLRAPADALGEERIAFAEGVRLLAVDRAEDLRCWDALLALGCPAYGVRDTLWLDARPEPRSVLAALAFGMFSCSDGEPLAHLEESPRHVAWVAAGPEAVAEVVLRGGFAAASIPGARGIYQDQGGEGTVRLVVRHPRGTTWTQPRFVAPVPATGCAP